MVTTFSLLVLSGIAVTTLVISGLVMEGRSYEDSDTILVATFCILAVVLCAVGLPMFYYS